ncbi:MAG: Stp1/IreP family PP2C-type Ser/Thr phosphatase [Anaerolineae bacterium]|nr:Stp1/IreP family PP2C-type Ser/Thr phosphatase [Anaerolineae bacterium]
MAELGQIQAHLTTDTGLVREHNEDYIACREPVDPQDIQQNGWIYLVADGVGGADAGEVASHFASERMIAHFVENQQEPDWGRRLLDAMQAANSDLRQLVAERNNNSRMATTMVTAVLKENQVFIGNVGDSRAYHWRNGQLQQITRDQSLVAKLLEEGAITEAEAEVHPRKNVILYSLGSENKPKIELFTLTLLSGDIILLCSDGLTRHVSDREINETLGKEAPDVAAELLMQMARQRGGEDNISVVVIQYGQAIGKDMGDTAVTRPQAAAAPSHRSFLWLYTGFLAVFMIVLIFIAWLVLRV